MKNYFLSLIILSITISAIHAQETKPLPRTEFALALSQSSVKVNTGESTTIDLDILRSKTYKKSTATLGLSSSLPDGVVVTFEPKNGLIDKTTVKIAVGTTTKPGEYLLILKATLQNHTKGATIKLIINNNADNATTSGR
jgi:hypothetical protein